MKKTTIKGWMLFALAVLTGTTIMSCSSDDNIDLGELDTTIGIGSDGLTLPSSSTKDSPLGDLLELKEDGVIDTLANGDYQFAKSDTIDPAKPKVKEVSFTQDNVTPSNIPFGIDGTMWADKLASLNKTYSLPSEGPTKITEFDFSDPNGNAQIVKLEKADVSGGVKLDINLPDIAYQVSQVSMDVYVPKFFLFDETGKTVDKTTDANYNIVKLTNLSTSQKYTLDLTLKNIENFQETIPSPTPESYVVVNPTTIAMHGQMKVLMHFTTNDIVATAPGASTIGVDNIQLGNANHEFVISHAEGYFNPDINIDPKSTSVGDDIPDFLDDERVKIMLYNPAIKLAINNNVDVEGNISGVMTAVYTDKKDATKKTRKRLNIAGPIIMKQAPGHSVVKSEIMICRYKPTTPDLNVQYIELRGTGETMVNDTMVVEDLAKILYTIPDSIEFKFEAKANTSKKGSVDLYKDGTENDPNAFGCDYSIEPTYDFSSPLALEAGSTIVYNDTIDDWNEDLQDNKIDFYQDGHILVEATVNNNTPLDLVIDNPKPIGVKDANGVAKQISEAKVEIVDENGKPKVGGITIYKQGDPMNTKLYLKVSGKIENLDGIIFEVVAKARAGAAETLNASRHTVQIKDVRLKLNGRITIDLDK